MLVMHQGDQYYLPVIITTDGIVVTPGMVDDVKVKVESYIKSYSDNELEFSVSMNCWLYPLTAEESRSFMRNRVDVQVAVRIADSYAYSAVQKTAVSYSTITADEGWAGGPNSNVAGELGAVFLDAEDAPGIVFPFSPVQFDLGEVGIPMSAKQWADLSMSYAVGHTGVREGENEDNAKYYSELAARSSAQAVADITTEGERQINLIDAKGNAELAAIISEGDSRISAIETKGDQAIATITSEGTRQVGLVNSAGTTQTAAVSAEGTRQVGLVEAKGETELAAIETEGSAKLSAITEEGTRQVGLVEAKGEEELSAIEAEGTAQVSAIEAEGTSQLGLVNSAGTTQIAAVQAEGATQVERVQEAVSDVVSEVEAYVASAEGYAENASTSATNAASSATAAQGSATAAATSATNAASSATAAAGSASDAEDFATASASSASDAETAASNAAQAVSNASDYADAAALSATGASNSATAASASATQAATSATNAANSATTAATHETGAATSATNAAASATSAASFASAANTAATNAATSESNASDYADAAAQSESNAGTYASNAVNAASQATSAASSATASANAAQASATTAANAVSSAVSAADSAAASATAAESSALDAATSATNAASYEGAVVDAANAAALSATNAANSASTASGYVTEASGYATAAAGSATNAENYAESAENYATAAAGSASDAADSATSAAGAVSAASGYANTAAQSAASAAEYANNAQGSADVAENAATNASGSATSASDAATRASTSASSASNSAVNASASATQASDAASEATNSASSAALSASIAQQSAAEVEHLIGAPLQASSVSQMTDTTRIYVYTGSETGMSTGHWYYYNGTSWSDGGVYNAVAVDTDTTLSVSGAAADAKATGDGIRASAITETASGSFVTIYDGADAPIKGAIIQVDPIQSGTGDPSPTNIRPISGRTGLTVVRTGRNLLGGDALVENIEQYIPTATVNQTNKTVSFTSSASTASGVSGFTGPLSNHFKANTQYTIIFTGVNSAASRANFYVNYSDGTNDYFGDFGTAKSTIAITTASGKTVSSIVKRNNGGTTTLYYEECGVFEGVVSASGFVPYSGQTIDIEFPLDAGTVYGGEVTLLGDGSGLLTVDSANIASYSGQSLPSSWISDRDVYIAGTNPTTGAQVVYKLAEPVTYSVSADSLRTTLGFNNMWADSGALGVDYVASLEDYLESKFLSRGYEPKVVALPNPAQTNGEYLVQQTDGQMSLTPYEGDKRIPNVTAADNGMVLGVVNGIWDKTYVSDGSNIFLIHATVTRQSVPPSTDSAVKQSGTAVVDRNPNELRAAIIAKMPMLLFATYTDDDHTTNADPYIPRNMFIDVGESYEEVAIEFENLTSYGGLPYSVSARGQTISYYYERYGDSEPSVQWLYSKTEFDSVPKSDLAKEMFCSIVYDATTQTYTPNITYNQAYNAIINDGTSVTSKALHFTILQGTKRYPVFGYEYDDLASEIVLYAANPSAESESDVLLPSGVEVLVYKWSASDGVTYSGSRTVDIPVLPDVTAADNGKMLGVVNGAWDKTDVPKELPSVTSSDNGKMLGVTNGAWNKMDVPKELPSVTASDNGKVLGVANGTWTKTAGLPSLNYGDDGKYLSVVGGAWSKTDPPYKTEFNGDSIGFTFDDVAYDGHAVCDFGQVPFQYFPFPDTFDITYDDVSYTLPKTSGDLSFAYYGDDTYVYAPIYIHFSTVDNKFLIYAPISEVGTSHGFGYRHYDVVNVEDDYKAAVKACGAGYDVLSPMTVIAQTQSVTTVSDGVSCVGIIDALIVDQPPKYINITSYGYTVEEIVGEFYLGDGEGDYSGAFYDDVAHELAFLYDESEERWLLITSSPGTYTFSFSGPVKTSVMPSDDFKDAVLASLPIYDGTVV